MGALSSPHIHGTRVPVEEPSTASRADRCAQHDRAGRDAKALSSGHDNGFRRRFHERGVAVALVGAQHFAQL